jgi:hypothetical protein
MRVPFPEQRDHQILEVTMIWRRADETSAWLQSLETGFGPRARRVEVLDNFSADDDVERRFAELHQDLRICGEKFKASIGVCLACQVDPLRT